MNKVSNEEYHCWKGFAHRICVSANSAECRLNAPNWLQNFHNFLDSILSYSSGSYVLGVPTQEYYKIYFEVNKMLENLRDY